MFLSWSALAFVILAVAVVWFWQDSLAARERANAVALEACEQLSLQFLDGTVAFARIALARGPRGSLALRRTYVFDYTANSIERLQGFVVLLSRQVETVGYAPGEHERQARLKAASTAASQRPSSESGPSGTGLHEAKVLSLEEWRASHRSPTHPPRENREDRGDGRH